MSVLLLFFAIVDESINVDSGQPDTSLLFFKLSFLDYDLHSSLDRCAYSSDLAMPKLFSEYSRTDTTASFLTYFRFGFAHAVIC